MGSPTDFIEGFLHWPATAVALRKALGIAVLIIGFIVLRRIWKQSVIQFKNGMVSRDGPIPGAEASRRQQPPAAKRNWDAQFVRLCRASGLTFRTMTTEWKKLKRAPAPPSGQICPKCGRTYVDAQVKFCPADGTKLMNSDG